MSSAAQRMRALRRRKKAGLVVCPVVVPEQLIDRLICRGYLTDTDADDRQAVGEAVGKVLKEWSAKKA